MKWFILTVVLVAGFLGCSNESDQVWRPEATAEAQPLEMYVRPDLSLFIDRGATVQWTESICEDRNVVYIGCVGAPLQAMIKVGDPGESPETATMVYIHEQLVPGTSKSICQLLREIIGAKWQGGPPHQQWIFYRFSVNGEDIHLNDKLRRVDGFFTNTLGLDLQGGPTPVDAPQYFVLGKKVIAATGQTVTSGVSFWFE